MPDNNMDKISSFTQDVIVPEDTGDRAIQSINAFEKRNADASNSTISENLSAAFDAFKTVNGSVGIFDYLDTQYQYEKDPEFVKTWDMNEANLYMAQFNLPYKYLPRVMDATSQVGLAEITRGIQRDMDREENIQKHLGPKAEMAASVAGLMIDADLAIPFTKVAKAGSVIKALSKPMTMEAAWVTARSMTDDDYTTTDAMLDVAMVGTIMGGMSMYQRRNLDRVSTLKGVAPDVEKTSTKNAEDIYKAKENVAGKVEPEVVKKEKEAIDDIARNADGMDAKLLNDEKESLTAVKHESDISKANVHAAAEELRDIIATAEITKDKAGARLTQQLDDMVKEVEAVDHSLGQSLRHAFNVKTGEFVAPKLRVRTNSNGTVSIVSNKGKARGRVIPASIAVSLFGAGALNASDGSDIQMSDLGSYVLALVAAGFIGRQGYKEVKETGSIRQAAVAGYQNMMNARKATSMLVNSKATRILKTDTMMFRTALTETYAPFAKAGGKAKELADKFLVNAFDGTSKPAEVMKRKVARVAEMGYRKVEHDAFTQWMNANHSDVGRVKNPLRAAKLHREFRQAVVDQVEFGNSPDKFIKQAAEALQREIASLTDQAVEAGVKGFDKIKPKSTYIPRYWKNASIRGIMEGTATEAEKIANRKQIIKAMANMVYGGMKKKNMTEAENIAESWVDDILNQRATESNRQRNSMLGRIQQMLDEKGITDVTDAELASALSKESDKIGRAMYRRKLDLKAFEEFQVSINGKTETIKLDDFIERDAAIIMQRYSNEMGGQIALANNGFNTTEAARKAVDQIPDPKLRQRMHYVVDMLTGEQLLHLGKEEQTFLEMATAATFIVKLPYVTFAMLSEVAKVATAKNGMKTALQAFYETVAGSGKYSALRDELSRATGLGTSVIRRESGFRGADEISNVYDAGHGALHNYLRGAKDIASIWYGLLPVSDGLQRIAMVANATRLAQFLETGKGINEMRRIQYGITPEAIKVLKNRFVMKNGELQKLDIDSWSDAEKVEFNNIIFRMNQALTQETTMGGTALYMHNSVVGKAASYLLTFPAEAFSNHGLRDLASADYESFLSMSSFLLGAYTAMKLRYAVQDKDVDDDVILYRAITQMPLFGAISTVEGITDPVVLDVLQNLTEFGKMSNYEKDFTDGQ